MIATAVTAGPQLPKATPAPTTPPAPKAPDTTALVAKFEDIAATLASDDEVLTSMAAKNNPVGTGWAPHLSSLSSDLLAARDLLVAAKPDAAADLGAKLAVDQRKLAEASGSMAVFARQGLLLSDAWGSYLDGTIADVKAAIELLKPVDPPKPQDPKKPTDPPKPADPSKPAEPKKP